jgi:GT2 family glycosyltransferase
MPVTGAVSALIVNYRSYAEVDACLAALRSASPALEVVVVDHASDGRALDAVRATHAGVTFVPVAENPGFGAGVNRAARHASGRYLLVLNPDTLVEKGTVERLAGWLESHPRVAVVGPQVRTMDGRVEASARAFPGWSTVLGGRSTWLSRVWPDNPLTTRNLLSGRHARDPIDVDWVSGACMMVRRGAFDEVEGFDERFFLYWEDADLCRRLADAGWTVTYHPGCRAAHAGGRSSAHQPAASAVAFHRSAFRYFWKHGGPGRRLLAPAVWLALAARLGVVLAFGTRARD